MLRRIVFASLLTAGFILPALATAQTDDAVLPVHPVIGKKAPVDLKSADILALPQAEKQAWIHGAVSMTIQAIGAHDEGAAKCALDWYFGGERGTQVVPLALKKYEELPATSVVAAAVFGVCKPN